MASHRMSQESFDSIMQAKAKRYQLEQSDPIKEALQQLRVHSQPLLEAQYGGEEEERREDRKYAQSDWRGELRGDYSASSYRSSSRDVEGEEYREKSFSQASSRNRGYVPSSLSERDYASLSSVGREGGGPSSRDRDYRQPTSRERDYGSGPSGESSRHPKVGYGTPELLGNFQSPGLLEDEFGTVGSSGYDSLVRKREANPSLHVGRGSGPRGQRDMVIHSGTQNKREMSAPIMKRGTNKLASMEDPSVDHLEKRTMSSTYSQPSLGTQKNTLQAQSMDAADPSQDELLTLGPVDPLDVFSTFGIEIIKWAGFHRVKRDKECLELFRTLFAVETETCAKVLASYKCALKPDHQLFCLYSLKNLEHLAMKKPQVDNNFLNFLMEHKVMGTKQSFFDVIGPFDRVVMKLQFYLLKSTTPLLMACNAYELNLKTNNLGSPAQLAAAFETTISLCRKSLVLLGQTFALATAERQERILDALSIPEAPSPTLFPNFDTSALFGREYIEHLQSWLKKTGYKMRLKKGVAQPSPQSPQPTQETKSRMKTPQRADRKVVATIEKLVSSIVSGGLTEKERSELRSNPEYWFLKEEESLEYKYYQLKLSEAERISAKDEATAAKVERTPEQRTADAVRALLYRKKIAGIRNKLFQRKKPGILHRAARARRVKKATVGTQTSLSADMMLKLIPPLLPPESQATSGDASPDPASTCASMPVSEEVQPALECQFPDVDPKTIIMAQKLAEFVAEIGPEIEQFSIENSADNKDLWFLQDQESSAFKFYRLKVRELCPSIHFDSMKELADPKKGIPRNLTEGAAPNEMEVEGSSKGPEEAPQPSLSKGGEGSDGAAMGPSPLSASASSSHAPFGHKRRRSSKSLKVGLIPASKRVCLIDEPKVHDPVQIAYDRPRGYPAYKNKKQPKDLEYQHKRLNQKNIGFQMLQKMGWKEGLGLGSHGKGIQEPVKVGSTSAGEGLGGTGNKKEDTFATFRQRMIQMYYLKRANK